jgi:hypothetical protein
MRTSTIAVEIANTDADSGFFVLGRRAELMIASPHSMAKYYDRQK